MPQPATLAPPPVPYFRAEPPDDGLTPEQLRALFAPLGRDYRDAAVRTAALPNAERMAVLRERLERYSDALAEALGDATDDATVILRGPRQIGGQR